VQSQPSSRPAPLEFGAIRNPEISEDDASMDVFYEQGQQKAIEGIVGEYDALNPIAAAVAE
jgi:hypothetical protein